MHNRNPGRYRIVPSVPIGIIKPTALVIRQKGRQRPTDGPQLDSFKTLLKGFFNEFFIDALINQLRDVVSLEPLSDFVGTLLDFFSTALIVLCCASTAAAGSAASAGSVNKKSRAGTNNSMMDPTNSATAGIQNDTATNVLPVAINTHYVPDVRTVRI